MEGVATKMRGSENNKQTSLVDSTVGAWGFFYSSSEK